jgi:hypothetical protein
VKKLISLILLLAISASAQNSHYPPHNGTGGVSSLNGLIGSLNLLAGTGITITPSGTNITIAATGGGTGTVTSVGFSDASTSPIYAISGSPVTTSGTLTETLNTQSANTVFSGPTTGAAAQPTFRSLVAADIPSLSGTYANTALSNLVATSINQDLIFDINDHNINITSTSVGAGHNLSISAGNTTAALRNGGTLNLTGGLGTRNGGIANISGGLGGAGGAGGAVNVTGGASVSTAAGGTVTLTGGDGGASGPGGRATISGGSTSAAGSNDGGQLSLSGGNAPSGRRGGAVLINGGTGNSQAGGNVAINGGQSTLNAGGTLALSGGTAGTSGNGGDLTLTGGFSSVGTGGNIISIAGTGSGGARSLIQFQNGSEGTAGQVWTSTDASGSGSWMPGSSGTVTSVGLSTPGVLYTVSGSPVTTSGTLTLNLVSQSANTVFAGPTSGGALAPTFRSLVAADIPLISLTSGVSGILPIANGGTGSATQNFVDLTTNQSVAGNKNFTGSTTAQNITINGTAGNGFINYQSQSATPATPASGFSVYADATNRFSQVNSAGFTTTFDSNGITGNRVYTLRDVSGKFLLDTRLSMAGTSVAGTTTILSTDAFAVYYVDTTAARTINLPTSASVTDRAYIFKDISGQANTNNISIVPNGTDKIEGLNTTKLLQTNYGSWTLLSDGAGNWWMI